MNDYTLHVKQPDSDAVNVAVPSTDDDRTELFSPTADGYGGTPFRPTPVTVLQPGQLVLINGRLDTVAQVVFGDALATIHVQVGAAWEIPATAVVLAAALNQPYKPTTR